MSETRLDQNWDVIMRGGIGSGCSWPPKQVSSLHTSHRAGSVRNLSRAGFSFAAVESSSRSVILSGDLSIGIFPSLEAAGA